jgi:membrane-bound ClpP family serine protease
MDPLIWAALLLALGLALAVIELFVPSGGLLGLLALVSLAGAIGLAFHRGPWTGLAFLAIAVVCLPIGIAAAMRWWPYTPLGRRLLLEVPQQDAVLPDSESRRHLKQLIGKVGEAQTLMTPNGAVLIEGRVIDALSAGTVIEPGQHVRVIEVRGNRVVVQITDEDVSKVESRDPLSQSIESLGIDPFGDPLA